MVNVATIIDFEGITYPVNTTIRSTPRTGSVPNLTYHPNDEGQTYPMGNGALVTIRGRRKEENPAMVEQSPEDIQQLLYDARYADEPDHEPPR